MPATSATAPAKLILLGEHAVVYGQPALAMPFSALRVRVVVEAGIGAAPGSIYVHAPALGMDGDLSTYPTDSIVNRTIQIGLDELGIVQQPTLKLSIYSEIPISAGLGASAAFAAAILRGLSAFLGQPFDLETLNDLVFRAEIFVHGEPSGIDNTVVVYEKPIFFIKGYEAAFLHPAVDVHFFVADTGIKKSTAATVAQLASDRLEDPAYILPLIEQIGVCAQRGRTALECGDLSALGVAMNENQRLLKQLRLSCPELDNLVAAASENGALGAKLTGGGKGGHILALVAADTAEQVQKALLAAGATHVYQTKLQAQA